MATAPRRIVLGIVLLGAALGVGALELGGCGSPEKQVVNLGSFSSAIDYAPFFVAKDKGWFEEALRPEGFSVAYTTFETLPSINESFGAARVDAVFEAEPPAIIGRAAGIDIRITGISCSLRQEILVRADGPADIAGLRGKKVAVLAGTSSHYGLLRNARSAGIPDGGLDVLDLRPPDAKAAFRSGQVDAWAVWPPFVEQEVSDGTGRVLPGGDAEIHSILAVRGGFVTSHPKAHEALIGVLGKAKTWIAANPDAAQAIVAKALGLSAKVVAMAWPKHRWDATLSQAVVADIQAKADFLTERRLISKKIDARELIQLK